MDCRDARQVDRTRVRDDEFGAFANGAANACADDGVLFRRVRSDHQDRFGLLQIRDAVRHRARAEGGGQTGHRGGVSEPGTVIDVVRPHHRAREFLNEIVLLVRCLGRRKHRERVAFRLRELGSD